MRRSLVRAAVRPGKKLSLQSTAENWQWRRWAYCLRQTVPDRCSSRREGSVADHKITQTQSTSISSATPLATWSLTITLFLLTCYQWSSQNLLTVSLSTGPSQSLITIINSQQRSLSTWSLGNRLTVNHACCSCSNFSCTRYQNKW